MNLFDCHTHHLQSSDFSILDISFDTHVPAGSRLVSVSAHPMRLSDEDTIPVLALLEEQTLRPNVVAIGETGLDKRSIWPLANQLLFLEKIVELSEEREKPLIVHCVKAVNELIGLRLKLRPRQPWIFHGFRGNGLTASQLLRNGFYLSYGEYFNPEALQVTPVDRLFVETDESTASLDSLYQTIARTRNENKEKLARQVWENARQVFSIA